MNALPQWPGCPKISTKEGIARVRFNPGTESSPGTARRLLQIPTVREGSQLDS